MQPSMVTHTQNSCSAFNPYKVHTHTAVNTHTHREHTPGSHSYCGAHTHRKVHTHTHREHTHTVNTHREHTHTPWTHTRQPFILRRPVSSWGFGALLKGTSVVVLRALYIHPPPLQFLPARDSNPQPFKYESDSLTIGPQHPPNVM